MFVGAYAALPPWQDGWQPHEEKTFFEGLKQFKLIEGLELPFYGSLHRHDSSWLLSALKPSWDYVITSLPGTMDRLKAMPRFGLASVDDAGRHAAIEFVRAGHRAVCELDHFLGRAAVRAFVVHSAPTLTGPRHPGAIDALERSISEIASLDWQGAELWLEHCDAWQVDRASAKGFLALDEECQVINLSHQFTTRIGILLNWGRSALEARSAQGPLEHLSQARPWLRGVMLSGCAVDHPIYGSWLDNHAPFSESKGDGLLLTPALARDFLERAQQSPLRCVGFKFQPLPQTLPVAARLQQIAKWLSAMAALTAGQEASARQN